MAIELTSLARPYAKAAFEAAKQAQQLPLWEAVLARAALVTEDAQIKSLLKNPLVNNTQVLLVLGDTIGDTLDTPQHNFLKVLATFKRLHLLPAVYRLFKTLRADFEKTLDVSVTSFKPLTELQRDSIQVSLTQKLGRDVSLNCEIDESLLGGAVIRAGDFVIDGSIRSKLNLLAKELVV